MAADLRQRVGYMEEQRLKLLEYAPKVAENYRLRLKTRIAELADQHQGDEGRLEQEVAIFAEKASIDEELVRLESHLRQFMEFIAAEQPVGRKMDFLCQEINREVNTIGSKSNDISMTRIVVEMKSELEKLREQVQNIE
jgi:uncharacterized protein (TIGR00255 family)